MASIRKGHISPETFCQMPGWKGSTVEGPMPHSFEPTSYYIHAEEREPVPAYKITHSSGAVMWLRVEQPNRAPFVATVKVGGEVKASFQVDSANSAKDAMRAAMADVIGSAEGIIEKNGKKWRFDWKRWNSADKGKLHCRDIWETALAA